MTITPQTLFLFDIGFTFYVRNKNDENIKIKYILLAKTKNQHTVLQNMVTGRRRRMSKNVRLSSNEYWTTTSDIINFL